ncbi:MAG: 4Fe-4S dicluster domain-containing protein [Phyllobacteriaceae bacterium]|nr:4Fe-4S dicluster domain-containing protein [Phyllobacteriaceae bacterium]
MPSQRENHIIYADADRCMTCHSCELACAVAHADGHDMMSAIAVREPLIARNHVVAFEGGAMPMQCRQCEDAPCTFACPTGACRQADGRVDIVEQHCIGCKLCVMVCPFGAITVKSEEHRLEETCTNRGVAKKCDLCVDWRAANGKTETACVEACPTKAIRMIDLEAYRVALRAARAREIAQSHRHMRTAF